MLLMLLDEGSLNVDVHPPSSRSSCFCGQSMSFAITARIMMVNTVAHATISRQAMTHPSTWIGRLFSACPTANVAVVNAERAYQFPQQTMTNNAERTHPYLGRYRSTRSLRKSSVYRGHMTNVRQLRPGRTRLLSPTARVPSTLRRF